MVNYFGSFGIPSGVTLNTAGRVVERTATKRLRTAVANAAPKTGILPSRVRPGGSAIHDIIGENQRVGSAYAKPPFPASKTGVGGSGTAKSRVKLAARRQELRQRQYNKYKQQQLSEFGISSDTMSRDYMATRGAKGRPAPGKPYKTTPKGRRIGPDTATESRVDYLLGKDW